MGPGRRRDDEQGAKCLISTTMSYGALFPGTVKVACPESGLTRAAFEGFCTRADLLACPLRHGAPPRTGVQSVLARHAHYLWTAGE